MAKKAIKVGLWRLFTMCVLDKCPLVIYNEYTIALMLIQMKPSNNYEERRGITVIELLVVIAIIGVLASVILPSLNNAREKGQIAKAQADLRNVRAAVALLADDTGKWPSGCRIGAIANPEVDLNDARAGLAVQPTTEDNGGGCEWTASDVTEWEGPYIENLTDPWGNSYYFDPDFRPFENCGTIPDEAEGVSIISFGPNGGSLNGYDCDDIYLEMQ